MFWSLPTNRLSGVSAAAGIASINSLGNVGGDVGSFAMGYVKYGTGGYAATLAVLATCFSHCVANSHLQGRSAPRDVRTSNGW